MGVPLWPLAGAYGLGLGHLAGSAFYNRYMAPLTSNQLTRWSHPSTTTSIKESGTMAPSQTMKRARSYIRSRRTKRKRFGRRRYRVPRTLGPKSVVRSLKTVLSTNIDPNAGGALAGNYMKLNSAFDPEGAWGNDQPLGFDQYSAFFAKYCVISWSVKIEAVTVDNTTPIMIGFTPHISATLLADYQQYKEAPATVSMILTPDIDKGLLQTRGGVKRYLLPGGGKMLSNPNLSSSTTADPTDILYGHLWAQPVDKASDAGITRFVITIWQKIVFFDPVIPARS